MLTIKTANTIQKGELHTVLMLCQNNLDGFGWHNIRDITNNDIRLLLANKYSPYIEETNIPQSVLQLLLNN